MPPRLFYELRIFRANREITNGSRPREVFDLEDVDQTRLMLVRHLIGAAERDGMRREDAHLLHMDVYEVQPNGQTKWDRLFQFAMPFDGEVPSWTV